MLPSIGRVTRTIYASIRPLVVAVYSLGKPIFRRSAMIRGLEDFGSVPFP